MDPKKQALSPELKEVYDRVMNTAAKPAGTTPAASPAQPATPMAETTPTVATPVISPVTPQATAAATEAPAATPQPTTATPTPPAAPTPTSFAFSGNKMTSSAGTTKTGGVKGKLPPFVIPAGVVVLVVAWGALWAKVFGLF